VTAPALLAALRATGFTLTADGDRLLVAPGAKLSQADRDAITAGKAGLLVELELEAVDAAILRQLRTGAWAADMGRAFRLGWGRHIPLTRGKEG
jgi:hypothetical protein